MKTFIKAVGTLTMALLAACSSSPQASTDGIEEMASLAGSDGNLEATIEIQSVGSSAVRGQATDFLLELEGFRATYKGKTVKGFSLSSSTPGSQVSAALATGEKLKLQGSVRTIKGVPTFIGLMRPDTTQAAAVAAPVPVVLVGGNKTFPVPTGNTIKLEDILVSSVCSTLRDMEILILRTNDGKPFAGAIFKTPTGYLKIEGIDGESIVCSVTLNLQGSVVQTPLGPVGRVTGQIKIGGRQPVTVNALLFGL